MKVFKIILLVAIFANCFLVSNAQTEVSQDQSEDINITVAKTIICMLEADNQVYGGNLRDLEENSNPMTREFRQYIADMAKKGFEHNAVYQTESLNLATLRDSLPDGILKVKLSALLWKISELNKINVDILITLQNYAPKRLFREVQLIEQ